MWIVNYIYSQTAETFTQNTNKCAEGNIRNRVWLLCKQSTRPLSEVINKEKMKMCWTLDDLSYNDSEWRCAVKQNKKKTQ